MQKYQSIRNNSCEIQLSMLNESQMYLPTQRLAELYKVGRNTLRQRVLGTHKDRSIAYQNEQLFSPGVEKAIADYAGIMADAGFPLNPDLLRQIAQEVVNERQIPQQGQGEDIVGPQ